MIEINLVRETRNASERQRSVGKGAWIVSGLLVMGVGATSWWWTVSLQQELEMVHAGKVAKEQSITRLQERLKSMHHLHEQKTMLLTSTERLRGEENNKVLPVALLDKIGQHVHKYELWLERIHVESHVVELQGHSLKAEDIGEFIGALEDEHIIKSSPVVEVVDTPNGEPTLFMFTIRFALMQTGMT